MTSHFRPRKRFGQHFLTDAAVLQQIVNCIAPQLDQHIVEIGPGQGALTQYLLPQVKRLDAIEIDRDLARELKQHFPDKKLFIHNQDVLKADFLSLQRQSKKLRVVGNLPYNITTPLLFKLFNDCELIFDMVFLIQKEVARRLAAEVGAHDYGRLSIMAQYFCDVTIFFEVGPDAFNPPPKVDSALIGLYPKTDAQCQAQDVDLLSKVVAHAFTYRRKTLHNALKKIISVAELETLGINPKSRPQELSVADYVALSNYLYQHQEGI